jgi:RHS repeat-associated protein
MYITDDRIIDYEIINSNDQEINYYWDITRNLQNWIENNESSRIIELSKLDEDSTGNIWFSSTNHLSVLKPVLKIGYEHTGGIKDYWTYNTQDMGVAGVGYVSDYTGKLTYARQDIAYSTDLQSFGLTFVYNDSWYGIGPDIGYGFRWRSNYNIEVHYDILSNKYYTIDSTGDLVYYSKDNPVNSLSGATNCDIRFAANSSNVCYIAEDGSRDVLVIEETEITVDGLTLERVPVNISLVTLEQVYYNFNIVNNPTSGYIGTDSIHGYLDYGLLDEIVDEKHNTSLDISYTEYQEHARINTITDSIGNFIKITYIDGDNDGDFNDDEDYLFKSELFVKTGDDDFYTLQSNEYTFLDGAYYQNRIFTSVTKSSDYYHDNQNQDLEIDFDYLIQYSEDNLGHIKDVILLYEENNQNVESMKYQYDYILNTDKVSKITSTSGTEVLGYTEYDYDNRKTTLTNHLGDEMYYYFDSFGHTIQVMNDDGVVQTYKYSNIFLNTNYDVTYDSDNDNQRNYRLNHQLIYTSDMESPFYNPVLNGSVEIEANIPYWQLVTDYDGGSQQVAYVDYDNYRSVYGTSSVKIGFPEADMEAHLEQTITLEPGQYQLSAYISNSSQPNEIYEDLAYISVDGTSQGTIESVHVEPGPAWQYVTITFDVPKIVGTESSDVTINLVNKTYGSVNFDYVQIKEGYNTASINLFENGSFEYDLDTNIWVTTGLIEREMILPNSNEAILLSLLGSHVVKLSGDLENNTSLTADITDIVGNLANEEYSIKIWGYSEGTPYKTHSSDGDESTTDQSSYFKVNINYLDENDNTISFPSTILFDQQLEGWQRLTTNITIPENVDTVTLSIEYLGLGDVFVDGLAIEKNYSGTSYVINDAGNIVESVSNYGEKKIVTYEEDEYNKPIASTPTSISTIRNNMVVPLNEDYLPLYFENNNVRVTPSYDNFGRKTELVFGDDDFSFTTTATYGAALNTQYLYATTNEFNETTVFNYDLYTSLLETVENAKDVTTKYEYYDNGLLYRVSNEDYCNSSECAKVIYVYNGLGQLTKIMMDYDEIYENYYEATYYYDIEYDTLGRMENVNINNTNLMTYTYDSVGDIGEFKTNLIDTQTYGNGDFITFVYDDNNRIKEVQYGTGTNNPVTRFSYEYNQRDEVSAFNTHDLTGIIESEHYTYNSNGRLLKVTDSNNNSFEYLYDETGSLTEITYDVGSFSREVNYDNSEELYLSLDILDETIFSDFTKPDMFVESNNIIITENPDGTLEFIVINNDFYDEMPSVGGLMSVLENSVYTLSLDIEDIDTYMACVVREYTFDEVNGLQFQSEKEIIITDLVGYKSDQFTTDAGVKFIVVGFKSQDNSFTLSNIQLDYAGLNNTSLYDSTSYNVGMDDVLKDYVYENNALKRLDLINLTNGTFSLNQDIGYNGDTTRIQSIEYDLTNSQGLNWNLKYNYIYDALGNITNVYHYENDQILLKEYYEYDSLNQLIEESVRDYSSICTSYTETCYTKYFEYDLRGNMTDIKIYNYGQEEYSELIKPTPTLINYGIEDANAFIIGNTTLNVGDTLDVTFEYYILRVIPRVEVTGMTTTCDATTVDTSVVGYYLYECHAEDRKGIFHNLDFTKLITVGDITRIHNIPYEHIRYNYTVEWLDQLISSSIVSYDSYGNEILDDTQGYTYDLQGNPTEISNFKFSYNGYDYTFDYVELKYDGRQLTDIWMFYDGNSTPLFKVTYTYNDQGYRTSKVITHTQYSIEQIAYELEGDRVILESHDFYNVSDNTNEYYDILFTYDIDGLIISFNYYNHSTSNSINNGEYYYVRNIQGDITKIINSDGEIIVEYLYDAWGNIIEVIDNSSFNLSEINTYTYRGYKYDKEINMYYLNSRLYNPQTHRFLNSDGLLGQQGNILGHNMYAYTQNNPVMYSDISGYAPEWLKIVGTVVAAVVIVVVVTALVTFTAGAAAYLILGAAAQTGIATVIIGAALGGLIAGSVSMVGQGASADNYSDFNFKTLGIDTFSGSTFGAISGFGGAGISLGAKIGIGASKVGLSITSVFLHGLNNSLSPNQIIRNMSQKGLGQTMLQSAMIFGPSLVPGTGTGILSSVVGYATTHQNLTSSGITGVSLIIDFVKNR